MAEPSSEGSTAPKILADAAHASEQTQAPDANPAVKIAPPLSLQVGPLAVRAKAAEVAAFAQETGGVASDRAVPFTFPVRWFAHPEIRVAGTKLMGSEAFVPIHESQSFEYDRSIDVEVDYQMTVEVIRQFEPSRLILRAEIGDTNVCLRAEMTLRIISTCAAEGSL